MRTSVRKVWTAALANLRPKASAAKTSAKRGAPSPNRITELQSERKTLLEQDGQALAEEYAKELSKRTDAGGTGASRRSQAMTYLATGGGWHSGDKKRLTSQTWPKLQALRKKIVATQTEETDKEEKLSDVKDKMDGLAAEGVTACIY